MTATGSTPTTGATVGELAKHERRPSAARGVAPEPTGTDHAGDNENEGL